MDIASLGLRIDAGQFLQQTDQAAKNLDKLANSGAKAEGAQRDWSAEITASQKEVAKLAQQVKDLQAQLNALKGGHAGAGQAAEQHAFATGKAIRALEGLSVEATGANHQLATLGVVLGEFVGGHAAVLGALAAIGVGLKVFEVLGEEEKKAREEQEKLTEALEQWYETQKEGAAGDLPKQIDAMREKLVELRKELDKFNSGNVVKQGSQVGIAGWLRIALGGSPLAAASQAAQEVATGAAKVAASIKEGGEAIDAANKEVQKRLNEEALKQAQKRWEEVSYSIGLTLEYLKELGETLAPIAEQLKQTGVEWTQNAANYQSIVNIQKIAIAGWEQEKNAIAARNKAITDKQVNDAAEAIKKQQKYEQDVENIFRDGIGRITTNGLKSFQNFFDDVFQLFVNLMKRMQQEGKDSGLGYKLLGLGASAASGATIGYQSGSAITGILGGAGAGFATAGAPGAIIGGLAGLTGALFGGAAAAKARKEAEDQLRQSLALSLIQLKAQAGLASDLDVQVAQLHQTIQQQKDEVDKAYAGKKNEVEREQRLRELDALEATINQKLHDQATATQTATEAAKQAADAQNALAAAQQAAAAAAANLSSQQSSLLRIFNATGNTAGAQNLQDQIEIQQAIAQGLDEISIGMIKQAQAAEKAQREQQAQTAALNAQISTAQDALRTAQAQLDALRQIHDSLVAFGQSLKVGQFSTLSPVQQLEEARKQVTAAYNAALGGDQQAAQQFPSLAQAFLQSSRGYNASGAGYVMDFNSVQVMTDTLTESFGQQMTDQQKIVAALEEQIRLLQAQLTELQGIHKDTTDTADAITKRNFNPQDHVPETPGTNPPQVPNPDPVGTPRGSPTPPNRGGGTAPPSGATTEDIVAVMADGFSQLIASMQDTNALTQANATEIRLGLQKIALSITRAA